ncbi:MAG: ABC transporter ATP-binding protein [Desulfurococcales archaeon]|nr:ABC transporter ATP-binding protein [Desulfurococcales archaeon]MCE4605622.1 ABC transporter ATP-binding protein [Desulfurococcales archaeon]
MRGVTVRLEDVAKHYSTTRAVDGLTLTIPSGTITTLLGPSGCGKTTTLKLIAGLEEPTRGKILFNDKDVTKLPPEKRNIGMVFQDLALFPHMTVFDNVAFGLRVRRVPETEIKSRVKNMLELVNLDPDLYSSRKPSQLSGGQQQRVALARALVIEPDILLLDEPFAHLDFKIKQRLLLELRRIQRRLQITTVYVTHDQNEAMAISDKVVIMNNGRVIQEGPPDQVYENPANTFVATFYGDSNLIEGSALGINGLVAIRPEKIMLNPEGRADIVYDGIVEDVIFQGPVLRLEVRVNGFTLKLIHTRTNGSMPRPGDRVRVGWRLSDMKVLRE